MEQKYSIWQQNEVEWKFKAAEHENSQIQIPQNCTFTQVQYLSKCTELQSIPGLLDVEFLKMASPC